MPGYVYVMSNPRTNDLKIGFSINDPTKRVNELYDTNTALPNKVEYWIIHDNYELIEKLAHKKLGQYRISSNREWFNVDLATAIKAIRESINEVSGDFIFERVFRESIDLKIPSREEFEKERIRKEEYRKQRELDKQAEINHKREMEQKALKEEEDYRNYVQKQYRLRSKHMDGSTTFGYFSAFASLILGFMFYEDGGIFWGILFALILFFLSKRESDRLEKAFPIKNKAEYLADKISLHN